MMCRPKNMLHQVAGLYKYGIYLSKASQSVRVVIIGTRGFGGRGGTLVRDPLSTWGATSQMGTRELLEAVDRAERARTGSNTALWDRLSCRSQALLPDFSASETCRVLFAFYRARYKDDGLLHTASEAILKERPGQKLLANDIALLMKAFSKHNYGDIAVVDFLLTCAKHQMPKASAADISHLLAALVRLGMGPRLRDDGPHPGLLGSLFRVARIQLGDAYLPIPDLTNLAAAAALLPPTDDSACFLEALGLHLAKELRAMAMPPKDIVRQLVSIREFDRRLEEPCVFHIRQVVDRLGMATVAAICNAAAIGLSRRVGELDLELSISACECFADLLTFSSQCVSRSDAVLQWNHGKLRPLFSLVLQRLPSMEVPLLERLEHCTSLLLQVQDDILLTELAHDISVHME